MKDKIDKKVLGVIPARIGSTRIPRKMLADIGGKTLIQRTVERSLQARSLDALIVSTDSEEIAEVVRSLGVEVFVEIFNEKNGTERVSATVPLFKKFTPDIVVNIWGDEPLYPASAIDSCVNELIKDETLNVSLAGDRILNSEWVHEPSIVQVLTDLNNNVLCFSRAPVPYSYTDSHYDHYHVIGVMALRNSFVDTLLSLPRTPLEMKEGVEQLRILEHGYRIKLVKGDFGNLGVNTPDELEQVREIIKEQQEKGLIQ